MSTNDITSESLDRLVDGELSSVERRELLLRLEESRDGWRNCALAFLEAQTWGREFRSTVAKPPTLAAPAGPLTTTPTRRVPYWAALAASLLAAFWLGGRFNWRADSVPPVVVQTTSAVQPAEPLNPDDVMTVWAHDANGVAQPMHITLVDADAVDRQLGSQFKSSVTPELAQELKDRGYEVKSRQRYAPLWLEQGQPLMLPVEDTRIVPISREVL